MPIFNSFLGCIDVLPGGILLAFSTTISRSAVVSMFIISKLVTVLNLQSESFEHENEIYNWYQEIIKLPSVDLKIFHLVLIIFCVHIIAAVLFIIGCRRQLSRFLIPYLIVDLITVTLFFYLWLQFCLNFNGTNANANDAMSLIYLTIILCAFIYLMLFAFSVYQHVSNNTKFMIENFSHRGYISPNISVKEKNQQVSLLYGIETNESKYKKLPIKYDGRFDERLKYDTETEPESNEVIYVQSNIFAKNN